MVCDTNSFALKSLTSVFCIQHIHTPDGISGVPEVTYQPAAASGHHCPTTQQKIALEKVQKDHRSMDVFSEKGKRRLPDPIFLLQEGYCQQQSRYWKPSGVGILQPSWYLLQHCATPWMKHLALTCSIAKKMHPDMQNTDENLKISLVFLCNRWFSSHTQLWYLLVFWCFFKVGFFWFIQKYYPQSCLKKVHTPFFLF